MPPSMSVASVASVALLALLVVTAAECDGECEDTLMVQVFDRKLNSKRLGSCPSEDRVRWPCETPGVKSLALQVVNSDRDTEKCAADNVATIGALNINTGDYAAICQLPQGICVNACGIDPTSNLAFCASRPGDENLLRIDCDFTDKQLADLAEKSAAGTLSTFTPVQGDVCFYGLLADTMQGAFDAAGNFWFLRSTARVFQITAATLGMLSGQSTATLPPLPPIAGAAANQDEFLISVNVGNVADIVAIESNFEGTTQEYLVGCFRDSSPNAAKVWVQQVSGVTDPNSPPLPIELFIVNANPSGSAGATWSFNNRVFCAYNNVGQGVYEPLMSTAKVITTRHGRKMGSVEVALRSPANPTESNDGMNCINAVAPFPPFPSAPTARTGPATTARIRPVASGASDGDPHIHTLDGEHYLLLSQGSFSFWRYSGVDAEVQSKKVPVDFEVFAHYSGHSSYTKGLLLVDRSGASAQASHQIMELTAQDCMWRAKTRDGSWQLVDKPALLALSEDEDEMTAFNVVRSKGQKLHVELLMKSGAEGFKRIGTLYATCKPHHHINMKMAMFSQDDVHLVKGQIGPHGGRGYRSDHLPAISLLETMGQKLSMDQDFLTKKDWTELGGSASAKAYLKQVDEQGISLLQSCSKEAEVASRATCSKFLGSPPGPKESLTGRAANWRETFEDCVFDVCNGGGEAAAELAAEIMNAF